MSKTRQSKTVSRRSFVAGAAAVGFGYHTTLKAQSRDQASKIRVAQIGMEGHWGEIREGLPLTENCELAAVVMIPPYDDDKELNEYYKQRCPAFTDQTRVYIDDYRKMLDEVKPDIVATFMPYGRMGEVNIEAARHGCHILTEKPIAQSLSELDALRNELNKSGKHLTAMLPFRKMGPFVAAHEAVKKGLIGEPLLITSQKSYRWGGGRPDYFKTRKEYGGSIPWVAIHAIDWIRFVTGLDYTEVTARQMSINRGKPQGNEDFVGASSATNRAARRHKYPECEDHGAMLFEMNNGGQATLNFDYLRPLKAPSHQDDRIRVAGSEGILEVRNGKPTLFCEIMTHTSEPKPLAVPEIKANLLVDFVAELRGGKPVWVPQADAFRATEVALKARDSADTRKTITL